MLKKVLISVVALFALIIVGLVIAVSTADLNQYKSKIISAVKDASGYDLKIDGDISLSLSPFGISASKISVAKPNESSFVKLNNFDVALELMPLLSKKIKVKYVLLKDFNLDIAKDKSGKFNFEVKQDKMAKKVKSTKSEPTGEKTKIPLVDITKVKIENLNIKYSDKVTKSFANIEKMNININNIKLDMSKEGLKKLALVGDINVAKIIFNKYKIKDTTLNFTLKNAVANLESMKYTIFGSLASAKARVDLSKKLPSISIEELIPDLELANFSKEILEKDLLKGTVNSVAKLSFVGNDEMSVKKTLKGNVLFEGKKVGVNGYDIDKIVKSYNDLKSGDLKKVGTSFLSSALQNGAKGKSAFDGIKGGNTVLEHLYVKIDIAKKLVKLSDVAVSTENNRVALKGSVNIVNESLNGIKVGILDEKGCATFSQGISGTLSSPKGKGLSSTAITPDKVAEVVNMISSFFGKSKKVESKAQATKPCSIFYNGAVKAL